MKRRKNTARKSKNPRKNKLHSYAAKYLYNSTELKIKQKYPK